jgi:hypothetical protein
VSLSDAGVHYAAETAGNPILDQKGSMVFYYQIGGFVFIVFPQTGLGHSFSSRPIMSVTVFSEAIPDAKYVLTVCVFFPARRVENMDFCGYGPIDCY